MIRPRITLAIATLHDHRGLWFTLKSLLINAAAAMRHVQVVVVDQDPTGGDGRLNARFLVKSLARRTDGALQSVKYIPQDRPRGVGPARNRLFAESDAEHVLTLDSHVLLEPFVFSRLIDYWRRHPDSRDLLVGPLHSDRGGYIGTHQELNWRADNLGTWAKDERGMDPAGEPFEVPTQGLGLFSCRRDAFPGFDFRQQDFGCAEAVFCQHFRDAGGRVLCCPWLRWHHCFGNPRGLPYKVERIGKLWNYLVEILRLQNPQPPMDIKSLVDHFEPLLSADDLREFRRRFQTLQDSGRDAA